MTETELAQVIVDHLTLAEGRLDDPIGDEMRFRFDGEIYPKELARAIMAALAQGS